MRPAVRLLAAAIVLLLAGAAAPVAATDATTPTSTATTAQTGSAQAATWQPSFPIRAAFYYPWFPETWGPATDRYTHYQPSLGWYDSGAADVIAAHVDGMLYAGLHVGIASWWGPGTHTDSRMPALLAGAAGKPFRWAAYVEEEGSGNPTPELSSLPPPAVPRKRRK